MKAIIVGISAALYFAEWFVIRRTAVNRFIPIIAACAVATPLGVCIGAHLAIQPVLLMVLALFFCMLEDWLHGQRGMTEAERVRLKDL